MKLAPFQQEAVDLTLAAFQEHRSVLNVLATGLGKTILFSHVAKAMVERGRVFVLAHRTELIEQAASKIRHCTSINPGIEKAERYSPEQSMYGPPQIVVGSIQTQIAGYNGDQRRMHRFAPADFSLVIVDECHHSVSDSYRAVLDHYMQNPNLKLLGVTATPDRKDRMAMGILFDHVAYRMEIIDGKEAGYLVPVTAQLIEIESLDLSGCKTTAGDFNARDLARSISEDERTLLGFASEIVANAVDRRTLVFADSIDNAAELSRMLNAHKPGSANLITGRTDAQTRAQLIQEYRDGAYQFLVNVGIATEGFDVPEIACVAMCRMTKSRALYTQMLGRGTRPVVDGLYEEQSASTRVDMIADSNKPDLLVLDFVGNSGRHKLVHAGSILGGRFSKSEIELAERRMREDGKARNIEDELEKARKDLATERAREQSKYTARTKSRRTVIDVFSAYDVRVQPVSGLNGHAKASEKQLQYLEKMGFETPEGMTKQDASVLIGKAHERRERGLVYRPKMIRQLKRFGYNYENMSMGEAKQIMDTLARNGWRKT